MDPCQSHIEAFFDVPISLEDDMEVVAELERGDTIVETALRTRPDVAIDLKMSATHYGIVLEPTGKYSLRRDQLGPLIAALDQLLVESPTDDALRDTEYFFDRRPRAHARGEA